jgi:cytochrome P450
MVRERARQLASVGSSARDEALGLLIACQDTTPNALTWAVLLLLQHPSVLAELTAQVDAALSGKLPTPQDLERVPLALSVFRETLRLYPPVFMTIRQAVRDLDLDAVRVRKGQRVLLNIYGIHRRTELFSEPEAFRPERWQGSFESALPRGAFIPFIEGPRRCLGSQYALMEGQIVLATLLSRVRLELRSPLPVAAKPFITLRPQSAVRVAVHKR